VGDPAAAALAPPHPDAPGPSAPDEARVAPAEDERLAAPRTGQPWHHHAATGCRVALDIERAEPDNGHGGTTPHTLSAPVPTTSRASSSDSGHASSLPETAVHMSTAVHPLLPAPLFPGDDDGLLHRTPSPPSGAAPPRYVTTQRCRQHQQPEPTLEGGARYRGGGAQAAGRSPSGGDASFGQIGRRPEPAVTGATAGSLARSLNLAGRVRASPLACRTVQVFGSLRG
jgi:hypothetical protein